MERKVKERLVGAAVLMAAAVILIPEMLSGHRDSSTEPAAEQSRNDAPIKTYTIDLSHSSSEQPPSAVVENRAPPPEQPAAEPPAAAQPAAGDQAKPEVPQQTAAVRPESKPEPQPTQTAKPPVVEQPTAAASSAHAPLYPLASGDDVPTSGRWAVQVGTFSKEENAQRLVKQLRDQGQSAFVMPLRSGTATLYRVRIGPMQDRPSAETALRELKSPGAKVVSHP